MEAKQRLESLDVLRGADLFLLTVLGPFIYEIHSHFALPDWLMNQLEHVSWQGFVLWDLIMPLFMFMAGVTIPFSMAKYRRGDAPMREAYIRIARRFVCLWVLGMIAQGNLLEFDYSRLCFYSNTLQTIATGYLFSALIFLHCKNFKIHLAIYPVLLIVFWAAVMFISVGEYGGGDLTKEHNLCEYIDTVVLGAHRDGFGAPWYRYTWILSSVTFIATVLSGMIAGEVLSGQSVPGKCVANGNNNATNQSVAGEGCVAGTDGSAKQAMAEANGEQSVAGEGRASKTPEQKALWLLCAGVICVALGWLWNIEFPVIKKIWTSSMVLVASGYSYLALAAAYWFVDVRGHKKALAWLKIFGMNSILCYMMHEMIPHSWNFWLVLAGSTLVLYLLYRFKIFLRV